MAIWCVYLCLGVAAAVRAKHERNQPVLHYCERQGASSTLIPIRQWSPFSNGTGQPENTGTIAAAGTTPHTATTGCSNMCQAISRAPKRATGTTQPQPAL